MNIVRREDIIKEKVEKLKEGDLVVELFKIAEELGIGDEIELQNEFSFTALDYVNEAMRDNIVIKADKMYTSLRNVYYVVELYLRGFYNKESYMNYEEFLFMVKEGKAMQIIEDSHASFILHINRLKKIIVKAKRKIPRDNKYFKETRELLKEIYRDLSICERYPNTSANLAEFYFGRMHGFCAPIVVDKLIGFISMEKTVYALYNELSIIAKLNEEAIYSVCNNYIKCAGIGSPFNLFEKVVNNYLFAQIYSGCPENLEISEVEAKLLIREIKLGTMNINELVNQFINKYDFTGYNAEYLYEYASYTQNRIDNLKDSNYFGELFIITPPD